ARGVTASRCITADTGTTAATGRTPDTATGPSRSADRDLALEGLRDHLVPLAVTRADPHGGLRAHRVDPARRPVRRCDQEPERLVVDLLERLPVEREGHLQHRQRALLAPRDSVLRLG